MRSVRAWVLPILILVSAVLAAGGLGLSAHARPASPKPADATTQADLGDGLQRSIRINKYMVEAESGPSRGENIYYFKCWPCHNQFQKEAPRLQGVYQRANLISGEPVNDSTIAAQIKNGAPGMPSFRTSLADADITDLESYLHDSKCCFEGVEPPPNPWYRAATQKWTISDKLNGGPRGIVKDTAGDLLEGIRVQLIAPNGVRTTVYSNSEGSYEFPPMQTGSYTLRIATPLEFKPFLRDSVQIQGNAKIDDIVLEQVTAPKSLYLPPTPEIVNQLSGEELLWNLPGTILQKDAFRQTCGSGCHSYQQILRNRYDERSWRAIVERMLHHGGGPIINRQDRAQGRDSLVDTVVQWLAMARGPDSEYGPLMVFPRLQGSSTHVVVTEYEIPRVLMSTHDVYGDAQGNIWYTSHRTRYIGRLDPHTGIVTEFALPLTPGVVPGTHHVVVDKNGIVWLSENWAHNLTRLDPKTGEFKQMRLASPVPMNSPGFGNFQQAPDGSIWGGMNDIDGVVHIDQNTGAILAHYPYKGHSSYGELLSDDGHYWAGGSPGEPNGNTAELFNTRTHEMMDFTSGPVLTAAKRGGFDPFGNPWYGGVNGAFVELDVKAQRIRAFWPPTPYAPFTDFYDALPDGHGDVWGGELHGGSVVRLNPRTEKWTEYLMPEPYAHDRKTWIDKSSNQVAVWFVDFSLGCLVRIQPRD